MIPWFQLDGITIPGTRLELHPFGVLVAIGVIAGTRLSEWHANRVGMRKDVVDDLAIHVVLIGFVSAHVFDTIFYYPEKLLDRPWELLMIWTGLSSYGGFFGAVAGGFLWRWRRRLPLLPGLDQIAFGLPLGWFFGRMGCFVVHDHPGALTDFFLAVDGYTYQGITGSRHDLGLYEVFWSAAVVSLFLYLDRSPRPCGFWLGSIALLYASVRFALDFLREADRTYAGLTPAQYSSMLTLAAGAWCLWKAYRRPAPSLEGLLATATANPSDVRAGAPTA